MAVRRSVERHHARDPTDDVRYALQWRNRVGIQKGRKAVSVRGATGLLSKRYRCYRQHLMENAWKPLGLLSAVRRAWPGHGRRGAVRSASIPVRSLLALPALQEQSPDRKKLGTMGVVEIYRCQRITQGETPILTRHCRRNCIPSSKEHVAQQRPQHDEGSVRPPRGGTREKRQSKGNPRVLGRDPGCSKCRMISTHL